MVVAGSREGSQIEHAAHPAAAAEDDPCAVAVAGLVSDGGEAGQGSDRLVAGGAKFTEAGDQGGGDGAADCGDRGKNGEAAGEPRIGGNQDKDRLIEGGQILGEAGDAPFQLLAQE